MTFSGQFYDVCAALGAEGYIISSHKQKQRVQHGQFTLEHRPIAIQGKSALTYYLGQILYNLGIVYSAIKYRADVVIQSDTDCFFVSSLLPKFGIQVIPSLHCVLWAKYRSVSKLKQMLFKLNGRFFAKDALAILSTSDDVNEQVNQLTRQRSRPIVNFLSTYRRSEFVHTTPSDRTNPKFQVLFAGRMERDKGIFDLLEIAKRFRSAGRNDIEFHLCGVGTALDALRAQVNEAGLADGFVLHGYCNKPEMQQRFREADVVIVPTQSGFVEGLNQVVIEGILSHRPVITSSVCPALSYVQDAVMEVPPDDVSAYGDAILQLADDRALYAEKSRNCAALQEQFYSAANSWEAKLKSVLLAWQPSLQPTVKDVPPAWAPAVAAIMPEEPVSVMATGADDDAR